MHQLENGYTKIANTLLEELARANLPANSLRIIIWAIRNTYGYKRKTTRKTTIRDIGEEVKMPIGSVHLAIQALTAAGILNKTTDGGFMFIKSRVGVQPTEQPDLFSPLNKSVQPTEQNVQPTERRECNILKETLKERERKAFRPPTLAMVMEYCKASAPLVAPERWLAHYKATGWKIGRTPMVDWKAAVDKWQLGDYGTAKGAGRAVAGLSGSKVYEDPMAAEIAYRNAFHDRNTAGGRCAFCKAALKGLSICQCDAYQHAFEKHMKSMKVKNTAVV